MTARQLNQYSDVPLYQQLAAILRERIQRSQLKHLDPLPSETMLEQEFEVSRDTVRRAIEVLRAEELVFTVRRRGTYVGPRPEPEK